MWTILLLLLWPFVWGYVTQAVGINKGYEGEFWWGFFLSFIGLIVVACKPDNRNNVNSPIPNSETYTNAAYAKKKDEEEINNINKLKAYKDLLDSNAITQEEFDKKKAELLKL